MFSVKFKEALGYGNDTQSFVYSESYKNLDASHRFVSFLITSVILVITGVLITLVKETIRIEEC